MKKIEGTPKTIRELFTGVKYTIHYYQREYRWKRKNIEELIDDLTSEFFGQYTEGDTLKSVQLYGHYFMGSVVLTKDENAIIDGQQRLTSLSLLIMFLYHNIDDVEDKAELLTLFYAKKSGEKSFNINVPEREPCLTAIKNGEPFNPDDQPESVQTIYARWTDINELMEDAFLDNKQALPFFKDWLIDHVDFIRIQAQTEQDAHKIFVSMNDRGLSLTPTEMLKGFLLSEIVIDEDRYAANDLWKTTILKLKGIDKEGDSDFIKTWLRAQYSDSIRERKKGALPGDFDKIGTTFHKWVREHTSQIGLINGESYYNFINKDFRKFSELYQLIVDKINTYDKEFRHIFYNASLRFTLQPMVLLAPVKAEDDKEVAIKKIKLVSCFLDIYLVHRIFSYKNIDYSASTYTMFLLTKRLRGLSLNDLYIQLQKEVSEIEFNLDAVSKFRLQGWTKRYMHTLLARLTQHLEVGSDMEDRFPDYMSTVSKNRYEIEHLMPYQYSNYDGIFESEEEFDLFRNQFGSLVLLPKSKNASYNDLPYEDKVPQYMSENLLTRSLNEGAYKNHPRFHSFSTKQEYDFKPYSKISKEMLKDRIALYEKMAKKIWHSETLEDLYQELG